MKNILSLCLCAVLVLFSPASQAKREIRLSDFVDKDGEIIGYEGVETNIKDEALLSDIKYKTECFVWSDIVYSCACAEDIQLSDMLKYIEYITPNYHTLPLEEYQKSPIVTLKGEEIADIIKSEFGEDYDLCSYGISKSKLKLNSKLTASTTIFGALPLKIEQQGEYITAVVLASNNDNKALAAMEYTFEIQNGKPVFKKAVRLKIKEQGGQSL